MHGFPAHEALHTEPSVLQLRASTTICQNDKGLGPLEEVPSPRLATIGRPTAAAADSNEEKAGLSRIREREHL